MSKLMFAHSQCCGSHWFLIKKSDGTFEFQCDECFMPLGSVTPTLLDPDAPNDMETSVGGGDTIYSPRRDEGFEVGYDHDGARWMLLDPELVEEDNFEEIPGVLVTGPALTKPRCSCCGGSPHDGCQDLSQG